jgi:thiamine kinase-like enzyme
VFIDYEYSTYNYPIYDIANYFNEFEIDFNIRTESGEFHRNELPENIDELRRYFVECYCLAHHRKYDEYKDALRNAEEKAKAEAEVEKMMGQFWLGVMLSNLMWGWWGIKVCKNPNINFDYLQYCKTKYEKYLQIKNSGLWKVNKNN